MALKMEKQRKEFTAQMVTEAIEKDSSAKEKEMIMAMDSDANLPTSSDEEAEHGEEKPEGILSVKGQALYEAWKVRELRRILRDREEM